MNIRTILVGAFEVNCYLVWADPAHALVVDPGGDADRVVGVIEYEGLSIGAYLLTHGHADHVSAIAELARRHPAPVGLHPADAEWAFSDINQMPPFYPTPEHPGKIARALEDASQWTDGDLAYTVIATPGHTPGSVCIHFPDDGVLLSGDTLFSGSVGRVDLPGGDAATLTQSLGQLAKLPDKTVVHSGHGPATDIGTEKRTNHYMLNGIS